MKFAVVTIEGLEEAVKNEVKIVLGVDAEIVKAGLLIFEAESAENVTSLRTVERVLEVLDMFEFKSLDDIKEHAGKLNFDFKGTFAARCSRDGIHDFRSKDVEMGVGEVVFNKGFKVQLKEPENTVFVEVKDDICIIGMLIAKQMHSRRYRVRLSSATINPCIAASLGFFKELPKDGVVVDPFCKDGIVAIEFALQGFKNVFGSDDSLHNVKNARVNSKVAGVKAEFSKHAVDWLETKFDEKSVDVIVSFPYFPCVSMDEQDVANLYKDLFNNAKLVLKESGFILVVLPKFELLENAAKNEGFTVEEVSKVFQGDIIYKVLALKP